MEIIKKISGAFGGIRTPDIQIRSLTLYPAELRTHNGKLYEKPIRRHSLELRASNIELRYMAEGVGFEPTDPLRSHRFSRPGP